MVERLKSAIEKARAQRVGSPAVPARAAGGSAAARAAEPHADHDPALDDWSVFEELPLDERRLERERIVARSKDDPSHRAFDMLRTRTLRVCEERGWSKIGITSPTKGVGKTVISVNLAFSMARQAGRRVLLLDLDLAAPRIASILAPGQTFGMRDFLVGRTTPEAFLRRCGDNLLVGLNSQPTHDGAEILQSERAKQAIADAIERARPTVVICDLSPALVSDDALNALAAVDCALMVVGAGETTAKEIRESEKLVNEWTELLGIVLNKSKESVREYYGY